MPEIKLSEAKAHLGRYAREAARGERFVITEYNKPVAELSPLRSSIDGIRPKFGLLDGKLAVPDDFDAPLKDFERDFYGE